jgi:hypothetical protein
MPGPHAETPVQAVINAARATGLELTPAQAHAITAAALGHSDTTVNVTQLVHAEIWRQAAESVPESMSRHMRLRLYESADKDGLLLVRPPAMKVRYMKWEFGSIREVPREAAWDEVQAFMGAPARRVR